MLQRSLQMVLVVNVLSGMSASMAMATRFDRELAFFHAPILYQDTDDDRPTADAITRINFDGNWRAEDNWDNLPHAFPDNRLNGYGYYSVVETCTHWFIVYMFFHPRDWVDTVAFPPDGEHENDLEGLLAIVRKDQTNYGQLDGIVTVSHKDFLSYTPLGSPLTGSEAEISGTLLMSGSHPLVTQEAKGHGLSAWPGGQFPGGDGIVYFPSLTTTVSPTSGSDGPIPYRLVGIQALWRKQLRELPYFNPIPPLNPSFPKTFAAWGKLKGNRSWSGVDSCGLCGGDGCPGGLAGCLGSNVDCVYPEDPTRPFACDCCSTDSANPPWRWDDQDDGEVRAGEMALDPANLVYRYFGGLGSSFSRRYLRNSYLFDLRRRSFSTANPPETPWNGPDLDSLYAKFETCCTTRICWAPRPSCPWPLGSYDSVHPNLSSPSGSVGCQVDSDCNGGVVFQAFGFHCDELPSEFGCQAGLTCADSSPIFSIPGCACPAGGGQKCVATSLPDHCPGHVCFPNNGPPFETTEPGCPQ